MAKAKRVGSILGQILVYVLIWLGITLLIAGIGIRIFWGAISVDQMMMNLVATQTDGGGGALIWIGIFAFGVAPIAITAGIAYWRYRHKKKIRENGPKENRRFRMPTGRWSSRLVPATTVAALVIGGGLVFGSSVHVTEYISAANAAHTMDEYYKSPEVTDSSQKRNVVMIYLESGEETLTDTELFEKDPFVPLKDVTSEEEGWSSIDNYQQYEGGGWTMAGITGTQCGVPLKGNGLLNGKSGLNALGDVDSYLDGLTCAGNVLKDEGFKNVFMGGANGSFAAKDTFLESHGYDEMYDLDDWRAQGEPEDQFRDDWGLSDKRLMENAREKVDNLHAESEQTGQPFNLSMLTVDTHEPPHIYDYCNVDTEEEVTSMFQCSMEQVAGFVDYMKSQGYLEDTSVVIQGDHLKHMGAGNAFHEQLDDNPNRSIFNRVWVPGDDPRTKTMRSDADQVNMMPTILEAAGVRVRNDEAGLGVSAFSPTVPEGSAQDLSPDAYQDLMKSRSSDFYSEAWSDEDLERN